MANGITSATLEDQGIQEARVARAKDQAFTGWCIGRGYEADYLEAIAMSDLLRLRQWLKLRNVFNRRR